MRSVVGEDPSRIQFIWQKLYRQKFYATAGGPILMSALAGIDQALWDIAGKSLGVPVHRLLGGSVRDRLQVYRWCGGDDNTPEEAAAEAKRVLEETNYRQLKMNATPKMGYMDDGAALRATVARMEAVRKAVGPGVGIGLDFHGRVKLPMCKQLIKALEPFDPLFIEEPVCSAQNPALEQIAAATHIPIATGERMFTVHEFRDLLERRCVNIIQPDCSHAGGISHLLNIARLAESYEVSLAPHCPLGPIALASCLAVDSCCINFAFQETSMGIHYNQEGATDLLDYLENKDALTVGPDGCVARLDGPGLGLVMNEDAIRRAAAKGHDWQDREWVLADGTPTTW
eukprot:CAMPEP_0175805204 /NCGR_PEP_ID=MMETSP0107_2-20121207/530_1 /TAXON_ID=195067 ORGANISM="Goniomonas pacifica, Strain CCMP1869" /NCGR_SAMPLE_ID=MMETSP0107_2 /ASSEMBLY_ACC=CAM_ASM_000203 /LENGTH=342 /DNA_ID=CAMNT_0017116607 /DNA_START=1 /DNA_END=1029 /DNA_ORIENTATION=-